MASTEASRRASVASSSEMSFADSTTVTKLLPKKEAKKEKPTGGIKLKKSLAKKTRPNKDTESNAGTREPSPSSPTVNSTTSKNEGDRPGTTKCKICAKPVENAHFDSHLKLCQEQKKVDQKKAREARKAKEVKARAKEVEEKGKDGDGDSLAGGGDPPTNGTSKNENVNGESANATSTKVPPPKKAAISAMKTDAPTKKSKKRKADEPAEGADKEPKKKKAKKDTTSSKDAAAAGTLSANDPPKPKLPKPKGPVNVELQCGVALPNGGFCARSLTCKSHSMGAKRSVPGRSAPYDLLLQQYQKKNQAKQHKALLANQAVGNADDAAGEGEGGAVDSEEEKDAIMKAVQRGWGGAPYAQHHHVSTKRRYEAVRRREMVQGALLGGRLFAGRGINGAGDGGLVQSPVTEASVQGDDVANRRASLAAALSGKPTGGQRKSSLGGASASGAA